MVPVLSYLFLKGRCRSCGAKISLQYPAIETLCGVLGVFCVIIYQPTFHALLAFSLLAGLVAVAETDRKTMEIPNGLILYLLVPAAGLAALPDQTGLLSHIIGAFCVSLPLLLLILLIPGSFGGGDVKLMAACGLALGWQLTLVGFFLALITGGAYGGWLLLTRRAGGKSHFAFGPFLALGTGLALLAGQSVLDWYLGFF
ncbi:MAG: prepilin peptidase, partial [Bacillota bacterium]|nr:prepilin peptidase [Bacillota bacterium]